MTHNEQRSSWLREGSIALGTGLLYGVTSVVVGHPFDTVKTLMHADPSYRSGMLSSFQKLLRDSGFRGLYRGALFPMLGSGLYRSTQFAVFEALYTKWNGSSMTAAIPHTAGVQVRVLAAGFVAATARAVIECPIEYFKVRGQTVQGSKFADLYRGFSLQWSRTSGVMVTYFILIDGIRRNYPDVFRHPAGAFLASSCSATLGFWLVWPIEVLKNQVQAQTPTPSSRTPDAGRTRAQSACAVRVDAGAVPRGAAGHVPVVHQQRLLHGRDAIRATQSDRIRMASPHDARPNSASCDRKSTEQVVNILFTWM